MNSILLHGVAFPYRNSPVLKCLVIYGNAVRGTYLILSAVHLPDIPVIVELGGNMLFKSVVYVSCSRCEFFVFLQGEYGHLNRRDLGRKLNIYAFLPVNLFLMISISQYYASRPGQSECGFYDMRDILIIGFGIGIC